MIATKTALIAATDAQTRQTLGMMLASEGRQFLEAASGLGALVLARRVQPDIILLSTGLPGLNGYAVCRRLREDPDTADMAVVILAGEAEAGVAERASKAGADACLVLPCSPSHLVQLVRRFLKQGIVC